MPTENSAKSKIYFRAFLQGAGFCILLPQKSARIRVIAQSLTHIASLKRKFLKLRRLTNRFKVITSIFNYKTIRSF